MGVRKEISKAIADNYQHWQETAKKVCPNEQFRADLLHFCICRLLEYPDSKLEILLKGNLKGYVYMMMYQSWHSSSSPFYYGYRKFTMSNVSTSTYDGKLIIEELLTENDAETYYNNKGDALDLIRSTSNKWAWLKVVEFLEVHEYTYKELSKETGIPLGTLRAMKRKGIDYLTGRLK